jgi:hypothetical protein
MKKENVDPAVLFEAFSRFIDTYESSNDQQRLEMFVNVMPPLRMVRDLLQRELELQDEISKDEVLRSVAKVAVTTTSPDVQAVAVAVMNNRAQHLKLRARSLAR